MTEKMGKDRAVSSARSGPDDVFAPGDANRDIARRLKSFYDAVEAEPIPAMLLDLLEKLDAAEAAAGRKA
ncbi:hypothetical protein SAMN05880582_10245 [Rhizobium sp. RU20A]|uniref:NepR family anti-sigma factor n=1 Tax=Rhizobium sp. RU20A TaxID=1907412 RepID=UPI0009542379|nr:NepR family anti-sigma factor [Rhizobium sp. RU20A]SIQ52785.1 hypothetical protein SAMN05880582_10245 [Rhizobium sp. RU20A]